MLEYDTDTSFFAVYDGHGGHEVATYSAEHLPQYLKNCEAYKKGDYTQALKDAFLEFDATLTTPEVVAVLKQIASNKDGEQNSVSGNYSYAKWGYCKCNFCTAELAEHSRIILQCIQKKKLMDSELAVVIVINSSVIVNIVVGFLRCWYQV
jgi:hypothetical protein